MKHIKLFETFDNVAESLGTYNIEDGTGTCVINSQDSNHKFTNADFVKWSKSGEKFIDGIDDLIIDAIMNQFDDIKDPNDIMLYDKKFNDKIHEIYFEWEIKNNDNE
jgi:hypothetical protein